MGARKIQPCQLFYETPSTMAPPKMRHKYIQRLNSALSAIAHNSLQKLLLL